MASVGIIANPAAGKDIRRLVAQGRYVPDHEKVNVLRRVYAGLEAAGVTRLVVMPDGGMLGAAAANGASTQLGVEYLEMPTLSDERDSTRAAVLMASMGVGCIVTLGGDGTNRAVSKGAGNVPLVPISTGTNNVFPTMVEGTVAGLAAGVVALGLVDLEQVTKTSDILEVRGEGGLCDIALVDVAVSREQYVGARAIWDLDSLHEVFLSCIRPATIGLSAIGSLLQSASTEESKGLHIVIGQGGTVVAAPVAPGVVQRVPVRSWTTLSPDQGVQIEFSPSTIALDGERAFNLHSGSRAQVVLRRQGPRVVSVEKALRQASIAGVFTSQPDTVPDL